jgi:dephospho-CoA kinase
MGRGGGAVGAVEAAFPGTRGKGGAIDRQKLGALVFENTNSLRCLESILHPRVRAAQDRFCRESMAQRYRVIVMDIPMLFETGGDKRCDVICVVTAPRFVQIARVIKRDGMTREKFHNIIEKQTPDIEKRRRADFVIQTGAGKNHSYRRVRSIVGALTSCRFIGRKNRHA